MLFNALASKMFRLSVHFFTYKQSSFRALELFSCRLCWAPLGCSKPFLGVLFPAIT
jgi:hypothetical protein